MRLSLLNRKLHSHLPLRRIPGPFSFYQKKQRWNANARSVADASFTSVLLSFSVGFHLQARRERKAEDKRHFEVQDFISVVFPAETNNNFQIGIGLGVRV
jgi:hypothetical protein